MRIVKGLEGRLVGKWAAGDDGDFNAEGTEFTETGSRGEKRGSREVEERVSDVIAGGNMRYDSRYGYRLSIAMLFTE